MTRRWRPGVGDRVRLRRCVPLLLILGARTPRSPNRRPKTIANSNHRHEWLDRCRFESSKRAAPAPLEHATTTPTPHRSTAVYDGLIGTSSDRTRPHSRNDKPSTAARIYCRLLRQVFVKSSHGPPRRPPPPPSIPVPAVRRGDVVAQRLTKSVLARPWVRSWG